MTTRTDYTKVIDKAHTMTGNIQRAVNKYGAYECAGYGGKYDKKNSLNNLKDFCNTLNLSAVEKDLVERKYRELIEVIFE
jgi:hypothetical protein